jgi:hypothetical protein
MLLLEVYSDICLQEGHILEGCEHTHMTVTLFTVITYSHRYASLQTHFDMPASNVLCCLDDLEIQFS